MALGTTNIDTVVVRNALGGGTDNVFLLCTSNLINKWSMHKPHTRSAPGAAYYDGINLPAKSHGLYRKIYDGLVYYLIPLGGSPGGTPDDPGWLDDFREYNHSAVANGAIYSIASVYEVDTNTYLSAPYTLIRGLQYTIVFSMFAGEIDPETIFEETVNTKKTGSNIGYGGMALGYNISTDTLIDTAKVFSPGASITQTFICAEAAYAFDIFYCVHPESTEYWVTPFKIENEGHKTQFPAIPIALSITAQDIHILGTDGGTIRTNASIVSTMSRDFSIARINYHYNTNGKSYHDVYQYDVNMIANSGTAISYSPLPFSDLDEGNNYILVYVSLQVYRDGVYTTVASGNYGENVTVHII